MSAVGMLSEFYDEAAAAEHLDKVNQWKATQPEFIAVKMTNAEIVKDFLIVNSKWIQGAIECQVTTAKGYHKLINGEIYKKVPNPKNFYDRHIPVIPWEN